jgi:hypothetical protein
MPARTVGAPVIDDGASYLQRTLPVRASSATKLPSQVPTKTVFRQTAAAVYTYVPTCRAQSKWPLLAPKAYTVPSELPMKTRPYATVGVA